MHRGTNRLFAVTCCLAMLAACKMTKQECKGSYGLVDPPVAPAAGPFQPPDGKPIILSKDLGTGVWTWYFDGVAQKAGGPSGGYLRDDFIGIGVSEFRVYYADSDGSNESYTDLTDASLKSPMSDIKIRRTSLGFAWRLGVDDRLEGSGQNNTGTVPDELINAVPVNPPVPLGKVFKNFKLVPKVP